MPFLYLLFGHQLGIQFLKPLLVVLFKPPFQGVIFGPPFLTPFLDSPFLYRIFIDILGTLFMDAILHPLFGRQFWVQFLTPFCSAISNAILRCNFFIPHFDLIFGLHLWTPFLDTIFGDNFLTNVFRCCFKPPFWNNILAVWRVLLSNRPNTCTQNIQTIIPKF